MTTFGCTTLGYSFAPVYEARSSQPSGGASQTPMADRDGMLLRGGRVVKSRIVDQKKSKKTKRDAPAKRNEAAAKALQHRNRVIAAQQQQIKEKENSDRKDMKARAKLRFNYVWVGNLRPGYTKDQIGKIFSTACGTVLSVSIRCSGGKAISIGTKIPDAIREKEDTQYAHVVFAHHKSARRAIETMNGAKLHNVPIIVTRHVYQLPEFKTIFDAVMPPMPSESAGTIKDPDGKAIDRAPSGSSSRPIPYEPTEILGQPSTNLRICNISFPADIC